MFCCSAGTRQEDIDTTLAFAKKALEVGQEVLQVVPVPYVADGVKVLIKVVEKVEVRRQLMAPYLEVRSTKKGLQELAKDLGNLAGILQSASEQIQRKVDASGPEKLQDLGESVGDRTMKFLSQVEELQSEAQRLYTGPCWRRCFHSARDAETLKDMQEKVVQITRFFQADCLVESPGMDQLIEGMRRVERVEVVQIQHKRDDDSRSYCEPMLDIDKIYSLDLSKQSPASVLEDVKLFLRDRLATAFRPRMLRNRGDLVDRLAERSEGRGERAEYLFSNPKRSELLGPLNDLYLKTMLGTIALLKDRFSPNDLERLLSTPTKTSVSVLRHLRSVVLFDRSDLDAAFRPIHITFSQFLVDVHPKYDKGPYLVKTVREHGRIAAGCLDTLVSSLHQNPLCVASGTRRSGVPDVEERVAADIPKHVRYACLHWAGHLAQSDENAKDVYAALDKFAKSVLLQWVETMAWMGRMDAVTASLNRAIAWQKIGRTRKDHPEAIYQCIVNQEDGPSAVRQATHDSATLSLVDE
ncbi:uncharacterized protein BXZ73DRAFT_108235 [Epithele typhae]|uniref:uncharacterized protein n=1 Tax=Epithele typhae TaxID=378194 RepID=UPI002008B824|nr:uncharacterized protein BXZ73DRAFT_108235 [Epithele typhae]KAH9911123.1 hypothetical protein BXZ73DRAFT_108235 [Epithele typhae]